MLREKVQRRVCKATFLLACVVPTLVVAILVCIRFHPQWRGSVMRQIGGAVGLRLSCDRLMTPRPGVTEVEGLTIADPATGNRIATCDRARWRRSNGEWVIAVRNLSVESAPLCGDALVTRLARHDRAIAQLTAASVVVLSPEGQATNWNGVRCELTTDSQAISSMRAWIDVEFDGVRPAAPPLATLSHDLHNGAPLTKLVIATGEGSLPCWMLVGAPMPREAACAASFCGDFAATYDGRRTIEESEGSAHGAVVFTGRNGDATHAAWRAARLDLNEARWDQGRVSRLHANVIASHGSLDRAFIRSLHQLGCRPHDSLIAAWNATPEGPIAFDTLAAELELDAAGLAIVGRCGETAFKQRGGAINFAVLQRDNVPLMLEPAHRPLPTVAIVQALWPDAPLDAPSIPAAQALVRRLPIAAATDTAEIVR
jgi:hypothetical protein